ALSEEDFGVLPVGVCDEAGVAAEAALRPFPHATHLREPRSGAGVARAERRGLLPLGLRRQARVARPGVRIGLKPAHVTDRRLGVRAADLRVRAGLALRFPRPALLAPPLAALVASPLDEAHPRRVADGAPSDLEGVRPKLVAGPLVVVREPLGAGAHRERSSGNPQPPILAVHRGQRGLAVGKQPGDRPRLAPRLLVAL